MNLCIQMEFDAFSLYFEGVIYLFEQVSPEDVFPLLGGIYFDVDFT